MPLSHSSKQGFTLIEIVSVLVILGILAAVAVPKYFDLQEESEKKAALGSVAEAQARIQLRFGQLILQGNTCEDAVKQVNDLSLLADSTDGGNLFGEFILSSEPITTTGVTVSAKRKGNAGDAADTGAKLSVPDCATNGTTTHIPFNALNLAKVFANEQVLAALSDANGQKHTAESNATGGSNNFTDAVTQALNDTGIDLSSIGSWAYSKDGILYWSEKNIKDFNTGDNILTMRYNKTMDTYTVGYITIQSKKDTNGTDYNAFLSPNGKETWTEYTANGPQTAAMKSSFDTAMRYYDSIPKDALIQPKS